MKKLRFLREFNNRAQTGAISCRKWHLYAHVCVWYLPGNIYTPEIEPRRILKRAGYANNRGHILADSRWSLPEITPAERYTRETFSPTNLAAASCRFITRNMLSLFTATRVQPTDSATSPIAGHWFLRFPLFFPARGFRVLFWYYWFDAARFEKEIE